MSSVRPTCRTRLRTRAASRAPGWSCIPRVRTRTASCSCPTSTRNWRRDFPSGCERGGHRSMSTLFAFLHHLAAFTLVAAVAVEFILIGQVQGEALSRAVAWRLLAADAVLGVSALFLLAVGLMRVFFFEKGASYYFSSDAFITKFSVFLAVALLSLVPTLEFLSWRKKLAAGELPSVSPRHSGVIRNILHVELIGIVIILLCAAIMARGGWV